MKSTVEIMPLIKVFNSTIWMPSDQSKASVFVLRNTFTFAYLLALFRKWNALEISRWKIRRNLGLKFEVCFAGCTNRKVPRGEITGLLLHEEQDATRALLCVWQLSPVSGIAGISQGLCGMLPT